MKWIALAEADLICGIGVSKDEALHHAVEQVAGNCTAADFKMIPCTNTLYRYLHHYGANPATLPWATVSGLACLPHEAPT
jgi:hypothetical protein